jgi:alpha,alpha-trehalose-phosphate synthase [UDP-forming]
LSTDTAELVVVANRLPVARKPTDAGPVWQTSPGGLVSALGPILSERGGRWVGWPGFSGAAPAPFEHDQIQCFPVGLSHEEVESFYLGFSNGTLWPLYHDAVRYPSFKRQWWWPYVEVNQRFARETVEALPKQDATLWIHDYQLQLVPGMVRDRHPDARIGFFLHIPFPPVELFAQLPWRKQILRGLLGADLVGFQTKLGAQNFSRAARRYAGAKGTDRLLEFEGRKIRVEAFPISIDYEHYERLSRQADIAAEAERLVRDLGQGRKIFLGVDRLDYTKGIDVRLDAFEALLESHPEMADHVTFVQVAVPSRELVPEYARIRDRVEQKVSRINGQYGDPSRPPVQYLYRSVAPEDLVSLYMAADVMAVTPLRDGMNLVAKEYVASRPEGDGVLVLSEFAGAAKELRSALQVNPHDVDGIALAFEHALEMSPAEQRRRMSEMQRAVHRRNVFEWARTFLRELEQ